MLNGAGPSNAAANTADAVLFPDEYMGGNGRWMGRVAELVGQCGVGEVVVKALLSDFRIAE